MNASLRPVMLLFRSTTGFFRFIGDLTYLIGDTALGIP